MQNFYNYFSYPRYQSTQMMSKTRDIKFLKPSEALMYGNIQKDEYIPYKNYQPKKLNPKTEKNFKMYELMELGFTVTELGLYLDTHPNDNEALKLLAENIKAYDDAKVSYVMKYGPICLTMGDYQKAPYQWLSGWPWEGSNK